MNYWLLKTDPEEFDWKELKSCKNRRTHWDGVRNYQARNYLKSMKINNQAFFYHSVVNPQSILGIVRIVRESYPDHTQFDPGSRYFDAKSTEKEPVWLMVDVEFLSEFTPPITRDELKAIEKLKSMILFKNSRLSVQPVSQEQGQIIISQRR